MGGESPRGRKPVPPPQNRKEGCSQCVTSSREVPPSRNTWHRLVSLLVKPTPDHPDRMVKVVMTSVGLIVLGS